MLEFCLQTVSKQLGEGNTLIQQEGEVDEMSIDMRQLMQDMNQLSCSEEHPVSMDQLGRLHRWGGLSYQIGALQRPNILSLRELGHRHSGEFNILWLNTYLMPAIKIHVPGIYDGEKDEAPAFIQRTKEIAWTCGSYDGIILCEVWTEVSKDILLQEIWPHPKPPHEPGEHITPQWVRGPGSGTWDSGILTVDIMSSGLLTIIPGPFPLISHNREKFEEEGSKTRDADAWSNKGIAQAVMDTGFNTKLEIYSTHLIRGGDFHDISPEDQIEVQVEQIDQLVSFVQRTHSPSNFIVIVGDFNIDASSEYYEKLLYRMEDVLGLEDVWIRYAQSRYGACLGKTDDPAACQGTDFADDGIGGTIDDSGRIDYVFVQKPFDGHDITVDVSRPMRRRFPRQPHQPQYDQIQYLSDHLGIEMKLFFASKNIDS